MGERVTTAIRFPVDLHDDLSECARRWERSMNWVVNRAVEDFLAAAPLDPPSLTKDRTDA